ncbi:hypothetical protein ACFY94_30845 [Streptomyces griseorubiginosus]
MNDLAQHNSMVGADDPAEAPEQAPRDDESRDDAWDVEAEQHIWRSVN